MIAEEEKMTVTGIPGPPVLAEGKRFLVKKAENTAEIRQAMHLRFRVFKEEQGRLASSGSGGYDSDRFDAASAHLLVINRETDEVIGTCRLRSGACVRSQTELYSAQEYRFSGIEPFMKKTVEVGRSCISPAYRNGSAAAMLWSGIAECRRRMKFDYMLGCASLETNDFPLAKSLYRQMAEEGFLTGSPRAVVRRGFHLPPGETAVRSGDSLLRHLPPLFKGYLRIGAKICGAPAFDREFGSIDFPVWFDFVDLPDKYSRHFKVP